MSGAHIKPDDAAAPADTAAPVIDATPQTASPDAPVAAQPDLVAAAQPAAAADPAVVAADAPPAPEPTLLDKFDEKKAAEAKPEDVKPDDAAKPVDEKPADAPKADEPAAAVEEPKADDVPPVEAAVEEIPALDPVDYFHAETGIKLPESIQMDDALRGEFVTTMDLLRTDPVKGGQALVDLHNREMTRFAEHMVAEQWRTFREMAVENVKAVMADPILGGAGHDTAMAQVSVARDNLASRAKLGSDQQIEELAEFNAMLKNTGAGNHPAMLRFMHNAARFVGEARLPPPNPNPPKDLGKNPSAPRKGLQYDNPTSQVGS